MKASHFPRRDFMKGAVAAFGGLTILGATAKGQGKTYKVGLIGCGGRGKGALGDSFLAAKILGVEVKCVALADYFKDRAEQAGKRYDVPPERCFGGPKCYEGFLATDVEIVLMAQAPLFRPVHLEAAVKAGKHCFVEKPVAVDPPGCRRVIAAGEEAKKKGLIIVSGTEMRHEHPFRLTHQAVAVEGALGRLLAGRVSFCIAHMFHRSPINPKTADDLVASWQDWTALSGDHIVEQHVHNIDIANWFVGHPPETAAGFGGRARRNAGDMYDFHSVDFDYGKGLHIHSMCRQINGCWIWTGHDFVYEKGHTNGRDLPKPEKSPIPADLPKAPSSSQQEQVDVLYAVSKGQPLDEAKAVAESSATAVLGRVATYTGKLISWADMMVDPKKDPDLYNLTLKPTAEDFEKGTVEIPQENVVPIPGSGDAPPRRTPAQKGRKGNK